LTACKEAIMTNPRLDFSQAPAADPRQWVAKYKRKSNDPRKTYLAVVNQDKDCDQLIAMRFPGIPPGQVRDYEDNDVTAYDEFEGREWARKQVTRAPKKERAAYNRLMADIEADGQHCVGVVTTWDDRMFRSIQDLLDFSKWADGKLPGRPVIPLYSAHGGETDLSSPEGRAMAITKAAWGRLEVEKQIDRANDARVHRRERGEAMGGRYATFGYERVGKGVLRVVDAERDAIQYAAHLLLGGSSLHRVAQWLNAQGFTGRSGNPFNVATVGKLLTNATLAARMEPVRSDPELRKGNWDPILDYETVLAIRQVLKDREAATGGKAPRGPKPKYLLTGLLRCGVCGSRHVHGGGTEERRVYSCLGAWWDKPELPPGVRKHHLSRSLVPVDAYVTGLVLDVIAEQAAADMLTDRGEDLAALRAKVAELEARLERHFQELAQDILDARDYARLKGILEPQIDTARGELARAAGPATPLARFAGMDRDAIERTWAEATIEEQRLYAAQVIDHIVLRPPGRGRSKGSGVGLARGKGGYFKDPIDTVEIHWRSGGSTLEADEGGTRAGAA
jgi:DNA invertase Pin-like site-specific DNA recombinase